MAEATRSSRTSTTTRHVNRGNMATWPILQGLKSARLATSKSRGSGRPLFEAMTRPCGRSAFRLMRADQEPVEEFRRVRKSEGIQHSRGH